jgi:3-oxoacyl-(acyl-carrier-protein) synthase
VRPQQLWPHQLQSRAGDHLILAAPKGSLESIATVLALREGSIPPTANLENLDQRT